jgi:hypothetical protein
MTTRSINIFFLQDNVECSMRLLLVKYDKREKYFVNYRTDCPVDTRKI